MLHLYMMVSLSVGPLRHLIFGDFGVLWITAWPVLAFALKSFVTLKSSDGVAVDLVAMQARRSMLSL